MRKGFILIAAAVMTAALSVPVFAGSWQGSNESGWKWQRDNGSYASSGWEWCDGDNDGLAECYYFNAQGICLQNTTTPDGFTVNADGAWADDGWIQRKNVDGGGWERALILNCCYGVGYVDIDPAVMPTSKRNAYFEARREFFFLLNNERIFANHKRSVE